FQIQILNATVDLQDALSWLRAFRPGISGSVNVRGSVGAQMLLAGWPPRIEQGSFTMQGADLSEPGLRVPVHASPAAINVVNDELSLSAPTTLSFGDESSAFRIYEVGVQPAAPARKSKTPPPHFHVTGKLAQVRDL